MGIDYGEGITGEGATQEFRFNVNIPEEPITVPPVPTPKPTLKDILRDKADPDYFQNMYPPVPLPKPKTTKYTSWISSKCGHRNIIP